MKDMELLDRARPALAPGAPPPPDVGMFERLAKDPTVDVSKLEKLIEMHERLLKIQATAAFDAAFSVMQPELPAINEQGEIIANGQVRGRYAKYEDIQSAIKPILAKHGFSLRHRNVTLPDGKLKIIAILGHTAGHREEDEFECPPDPSGGKNGIQAIASTRSYGMRYTTCAVLNIEQRGIDNDGRSAGRPSSAATAPSVTPPDAAATPPKGYDDVLTDMTAAADEGTAKLMAAFNKLHVDVRRHLSATGAWETLKARAKGKK